MVTRNSIMAMINLTLTKRLLYKIYCWVHATYLCGTVHYITPGYHGVQFLSPTQIFTFSLLRFFLIFPFAFDFTKYFPIYLMCFPCVQFINFICYNSSIRLSHLLQKFYILDYSVFRQLSSIHVAFSIPELGTQIPFSVLFLTLSVCKFMLSPKTYHIYTTASIRGTNRWLDLLLKGTILWDIKPCSPLKVNRRFGGTYQLHLQGRLISPERTQREIRRQ
jgi:hypothetical protein